MKQSEMSSSNSRWQHRKDCPNRSTNIGDMKCLILTIFGDFLVNNREIDGKRHQNWLELPCQILSDKTVKNVLINLQTTETGPKHLNVTLSVSEGVSDTLVI